MNQRDRTSPKALGINRRKFIQYGSLAVGTSLVAACSGTNTASSTNAASSSPASPQALDKIRFGTSWYAQAEHGGFYQAVAEGIYKAHGLDVAIQMGGPQVNTTQLLMGGAVDFVMATDCLVTLNSIAENIPKIAVAAMFQKSPRVLIAHPQVNDLSQMKGKPIFIATSANTSYWPFLKAKYGFTDDQKRAYNYNIAPFLADKTSAQQGFVSSEPLTIAQKGGFEPKVFLLADLGYQPYANMIETQKELVEQNPDLVQRFVDASIKGWYSYLENPAPANELIKKDNPEMTDEQLAYSVSKLKEHNILTNGEAGSLGIGAMTEQRWQSLFNDMVKVGVLKAETKYQDAFTLQFINKGTEAYRTA
ncbi:ABC transporter substrate-binding protein [Phormidium tenue FACHB-886]|nr:ABC transporter substrate-binding protein [Phormidium tenue FACHB-886]